MPRIPLLDVFTLLWFVTCWIGYSYFADWKAKHSPSLLGMVNNFRRRWMRRMLEREQRMLDSHIITNLTHSSTFFASTTLLILGGLLALLGTTEKVVNMVSELPFTMHSSELVWELKILLLVIIFIYGFFKFSWSVRQFNFCSILVGAAPKETSDPEQYVVYINQAAAVASYAGENFNNGLRAYYFGLAALTWFLNPWLMIAASAWVVCVLYWREFHSRTLKTLVEE